jgi:hypothetical protein
LSFIGRFDAPVVFFSWHLANLKKHLVYKVFRSFAPTSGHAKISPQAAPVVCPFG